MTVGAAISDIAVVSGGDAPTGTITFELFGPADSDCRRPPVLRAAVAVNGNASYQSPPFVPATPGDYQWVASYSGDGNNQARAGACPAPEETTAVLAGVPALVTTASGPTPIGASLTDTASLVGGSRPTGHLTFTLFGPKDPGCAGPPLVTLPPVAVAGDGVYTSAPFAPTVPGTYIFEVAYSGDARNIATVTRCEATSQGAAVALAVLTFSAPLPPPLSVGDPLVPTEVIAGGNPTGTITFRVFGPHDRLCAGPPAFTSPAIAVIGAGAYRSPPFIPTAPGSYISVASYSGDADNAAQTTPCGAANQAVSVSRAIPTIAAPVTKQATVGAPVVANEMVLGGLHPTGTVTFTFYRPDDPACTGRPVLASPPSLVNGDGTYHSSAFSPDAPGAFRFEAAYSGDADNIALTTDCNAANQAVLVVASGLYDPAAHPRSVIELEIVAFALLSLAGPAGAKAATAAAGPAQQAKQQGQVVATGYDNAGDGLAAVSLIGAGVAPEAAALSRGDRSRTWQLPGTEPLNKLAVTVPARVAPVSPLGARIVSDAGYLRAILGSASALFPMTGVVLALLAVRDVHGHAVPPQFWLAVALAALGVMDALSGIIAVAVFVVGVIALGGLASANDARTLLGLSSLWFAAPIIAGVARPLRRPPTTSVAEHVERLSDLVIASLVGAWAVEQIIQGLPGLSGLVLPITSRANEAAIVVLAALVLRMILETIAAHQYPLRLFRVHPPLPGSGTPQHVAATLATLAVFLFVALPYVGNCWQLYVGGAFFAIPLLLGLASERFPNLPRLYAVIPRGVLKAVVMLVIGTVFGAFVAGHLHSQNGQEVIRESFVVLSLPGLAVSLLELFGRDGPQPPALHWLPEKILGAGLLLIGVLFVVGIVTV